MYQQHHHSDMHRLNNLQHISLEKHQQMIDNTLRWQRHQSPTGTAQEHPTTVQRLRPVLVSLINLIAR